MAPHLGSTPPISGNRLAEFGEDGSRRGLPVPVWLAGIDCNQEKIFATAPRILTLHVLLLERRLHVSSTEIASTLDCNCLVKPCRHERPSFVG